MIVFTMIVLLCCYEDIAADYTRCVFINLQRNFLKRLCVLFKTLMRCFCTQKTNVFPFNNRADITRYSCSDDWLVQFSLINVHKGDEA